jgi:hypothetical protein
MNRTTSRRARTGLALILGAAIFAVPVQSAGAAVTGTANPNTVATAVDPGNAGGNAFTYTVGPTQAGIGNTGLAGFPTAAPTYGILTSGDATLADDPNTGDGDGDNLGISDPSRGEANDSQTLKINVNVPAGNSCLLLDYKFFSEEFPEFVNKGFNDGFIAELDATNWSVTGDKINAPLDFAAGYGDQVSVDTVGPTVVDPANSVGTTYDAATQTLTTKTPVTPGGHSVYLSIFDAGDHIYDSAVFLDNLRFNAEPPTTCRPPDIFGGAVGAAVQGKAKAKGKKVLIPIACLLPAGATEPCVGNVTVVGQASGGKASAAKKITLAKGTYSVAPGQTGTATAKTTKAGKRQIKKKGKAKVKIRITNTINGASQTFKAKL